MCGILGHISSKPIDKKELSDLIAAFSLISNRGPDEESRYEGEKLFLAFHRLSINGQSEADGQPIIREGCVVVCNGEIYNSKELAKKYELELLTNSDCECIPLLYNKFGFKIMAQMLEGVFAMALYDTRTGVLYLCRDPVGVRPMFISMKHGSITFASEAKCITAINSAINSDNEPGNIFQLLPGSYTIINMPRTDLPILEIEDADHNVTELNPISITTLRYIDLFNNNLSPDSYSSSVARVKELLTHAVHTRCINSDRPVGAFLSGGIDSSIVCMLAKQVLPELQTFSIGLEDSKDLVYSRIAADAIGSKHTEVKYSIEEGLAVIPELCRILETSDITTIRASIPMYLLSKYIKENTNIVVLLSGEGADEVFSGYLYNHFAPSSFDLRLDAEIRVSQLPWYDVLRADRTTASNSLEIRVPFLCKHLISYAFSINPEFHNPTITKIEKKILRDAFQDGNKLWNTIITRPKEAFSDGVGYSWKKGIADYAESKISDDEMTQTRYTCPNPKTKEALLYRKYYELYYPGTFFVPEYWMPSWADHGNDPSATVLKIHKELVE